MWNFKLVEDQDWYKRRDRMQKPVLAVSVTLADDASVEDVPIKMIAVFEDGTKRNMLGRVLGESDNGTLIQALNGRGDTLLCIATRK